MDLLQAFDSRFRELAALIKRERQIQFHREIAGLKLQCVAVLREAS